MKRNSRISRKIKRFTALAEIFDDAADILEFIADIADIAKLI